MRFRTRHVHKTVADYIEGMMFDLGWGDASLPLSHPNNADVPFQARPITWVEVQPDENGDDVAPNTVAITLGNETNDDLLQMGGGLYEVEIPLFIDIYGENQAIALSIAGDIKSIINYDLHIPVKDYTNGDPGVDTTEVIEFDLVHGPERPTASIGSPDFRKFWRVVKSLLLVKHGEDVLVGQRRLVGTTAGSGATAGALTVL